jgi:hypothetical protein
MTDIEKKTRMRYYPTEEELAAMSNSKRSYYKNRDKRLEKTKCYHETPEGKSIRSRSTKAWQAKQRHQAKLYRASLPKDDPLYMEYKEEEPTAVIIVEEIVVEPTAVIVEPPPIKRAEPIEEIVVKKTHIDIGNNEVEVEVKIETPKKKRPSKKKQVLKMRHQETQTEKILL